MIISIQAVKEFVTIGSFGRLLLCTISSMKREAWEKEISVNLSGAFYCVKQVFDDMAEKAVELIIKQSNGEEIEDEMIILTPSIVVRESTGRYMK